MKARGCSGPQGDLLGKAAWLQERALHWVALLQEAGPAALKTWLQENDPELICLLLKKWIRVHMWDRQQYPEEPPFFSLDQVYCLECMEPLREKALKRFLTALAEDDLAFYQQVLENVAWHIDAEFEDYPFHFRTARLAEIRELLEKIWEPHSRPSRVAARWKLELVTWLGGLARRSPGEMEGLVAVLSSTLEGELGKITPLELKPKYLETLFLVEGEGAGD